MNDPDDSSCQRILHQSEVIQNLLLRVDRANGVITCKPAK